MRICPCAAVLCIILFAVPAFAAGEKERALLVMSGGASGVLDSEINPVISAEYRFGPSWHGLRAWVGASWATDGAIFLGGGPVYTLEFAERKWALAAGCGPGYYERHEGADLGSHLEFYSFVELSRILPNGHRVGLRGLHISNGGVTERNPGAELLMLGYAIPLP